jgi:hypothetical protein
LGAGTDLKVFDWKEEKHTTMKQLQKPLVLFAWNVFVLWGVGKLYGYRWLLSVLLGLLALTVFASWMFVNVVLYDAIKALWCALYKRHFLTLHIEKGQLHDETVAQSNMPTSTGDTKNTEARGREAVGGSTHNLL